MVLAEREAPFVLIHMGSIGLSNGSELGQYKSFADLIKMGLN